jgi:ribonuclease HI/ADP-ribose pyrophosphatase YjhB (NUDIX family)
MKQRVVVQALIEQDGKVLLLHRSQGRPGIVGKYELPGGTLDTAEQPEDGLRRHLHKDAGLTSEHLVLIDVMSMTNREEGDIQHVFILYRVEGITQQSVLSLGSSYDSYEWKIRSELQRSILRDSAAGLLGLYLDAPKTAQIMEVKTSNDAIKTTNMHRVIIYTDGGSRGNPGPSAAAFIIMNDHQDIIDKGGVYLGITTNNQAEYHGVRLGLERAAELGVEAVEFRIDSMLVVNQLRGLYKIKNRELWPINERITGLMTTFKRVTFTHVPRELNQQADTLVNSLLDEHKNDIS